MVLQKPFSQDELFASMREISDPLARGEAQAMVGLKERTIMVVDDEPAIWEMMTWMLKEKNFAVLAAENGRDAAKLLDKPGVTIDAITCDMLMPVINGMELANYNFEDDNRPFIVCTTITNSGMAVKMMRYGVQDYLVKPLRNKSSSPR